MADSESDVKLHTWLQHGGALPPHHGYDPNQPRVPAGHHDGGQWTRTLGGGSPARPRREAIVDRSGREAWGSYANAYRPDGTLAEQRVFNRDGSRIVSEFNVAGSPGGWDERHTVVFRDGNQVTFQNSGDAQAILDGEGRLISAAVWTKDGPQELPVGQLAFVGPLVGPLGQLAARLAPAAAGAVTAGALALYTWLSSRKERDKVAVLAFKAGDYSTGGTQTQKYGITFIGLLTRDEVKKACDRLGNMQALTDEAVEEVRKDGDYKGPADFGTKVHKRIADGVRAQKKPNYRAEVSAFKSNETKARYGDKGSIRIDAFENRPEFSTVCIYDPKTGERGLSLPRMLELAQTAHRLFGKAERFIVIEVRPRQK